MEFPKNLLYTKDHEWASVSTDNTVTVGITDHAQSALGDIVYAELPEKGRTLKSHDAFGVVESIKAVSDLYCPVAGTVLEVNAAVTEDPALVNRSPYKDGWLIRVKLTDKESLKQLMNAANYEAYVKELR